MSVSQSTAEMACSNAEHFEVSICFCTSNSSNISSHAGAGTIQRGGLSASGPVDVRVRGTIRGLSLQATDLGVDC